MRVINFWLKNVACVCDFLYRNVQGKSIGSGKSNVQLIHIGFTQLCDIAFAQTLHSV